MKFLLTSKLRRLPGVDVELHGELDVDVGSGDGSLASHELTRERS